MKQISGYRIIKTIAKSEFTQIILVEKYGIKYILKKALRPEYNKLILKEFYLLKYLYPMGFVPKPVAIGKIGKRAYFIREWIDGKPIKEFLKDKPDRMKFDYMRESFCIIFRLQIRGIAIIDISPNNFFIDRNGKLYLIDLGFAYLGDKGDQIVGGTFPYIAPELIYNRLSTDYPYKADVFSAAAMFYEIFTGELPYEAMNPDALFLSQHKGPPPLANIRHEKAREILHKALCFDKLKRPTISTIIRMFDYVPLKYCFVPRTLQLMFSSLYKKIKETLGKEDSQIINIFSPNFPEGIGEFVNNYLKMRLEILSLKVSIDAFVEDSNVIIYLNHLPDQGDLDRLVRKGIKVIIFSNIPLELRYNTQYINFSFDEINETKLTEILNPALLGEYMIEDNLPLFVKINLRILDFLDKDRVVEHPVSLDRVASYLFAEFSYIIDFLSNFIFALPKDLMLLKLLSEKTSSSYANNMIEQFVSLLEIMEAFGFIETNDSHIILTILFDKHLRKGNEMRKIPLPQIKESGNIYDIMEDLLQRSSREPEALFKEVTKLIERKDIPKTHLRIFLGKLMKSTEDEDYKLKLLRMAIAKGFWRVASLTWEELQEKYEKKQEFTITYAKLAIGFGKYREAVMALKSINTPESRSLLLYIYALHGKYNEFKKILKGDLPVKKNAYYYIAMGFYHLSVHRRTRMAKNFAVKASEVSPPDSHTKAMSQYLYGIALREEGNEDRALRVLEGIKYTWDITIEALLIYFQLGYLYYQKDITQKAQYYFEYAFLLATEIKHLSFSVQAAFYLGYIYRRNNKLDSAYRYLEYTYKYLKFLDTRLKPSLYRNYFEILVQFGHYDKALALLQNEPNSKEYLNTLSLARLYYNIKNINGLKELAGKLKDTQEMQEVINNMILSIENKAREV